MSAMTPEGTIPEPSFFSVRSADERDCELLWTWAMDPSVRMASARSEHFTLAEHREWFEMRIRDPSTRIYIAEVGGRPVGQARVGIVGSDAEIAISITGPERGKGYGKRLLAKVEQSAKLALDPERFVALVLPHNLSSLSLFGAAGYAPVAFETRMSKVHWRYEKAA